MHIRTTDVAVITAKDGTGTRYVTDVAFGPEHGLPFSWDPADALQVRKPGVVDDLARKLQRAWPTLQMSVERRTIRVI